MRPKWYTALLVVSLAVSFSAPTQAGKRAKICANGATNWPQCTATIVPEPPPPLETLVGPKGLDANLFSATWADEFNGTSLDPVKWNPSIWYESPNPTINYSVSNGLLQIWPMRDATGKFFNRTLDSDRKFQQQYGFFEIEAKLPIGKGVWPGFWLFNHDMPAYPTKRPEIDILEAYPGGGPNSGWGDSNLHPVAFASTVWLDAGTLGGTKTLPTTDLSAAFHTYGMDWQPNSITFYFDGKAFYTAVKSMPDPLYVLFSFWYGSASGIPDATTPTGPANSFAINYVRVWKRK
jgi:beta-glucanase (GH16 family)